MKWYNKVREGVSLAIQLIRGIPVTHLISLGVVIIQEMIFGLLGASDLGVHFCQPKLFSGIQNHVGYRIWISLVARIIKRGAI